ncbi:hypothetical protein CKO24_05205 [Rhodothalassium salexigens DSM 2132]|nr:hypothetical protein [Rhodothalassium salexigens DSM 2132]
MARCWGGERRRGLVLLCWFCSFGDGMAKARMTAMQPMIWSWRTLVPGAPAVALAALAMASLAAGFGIAPAAHAERAGSGLFTVSGIDLDVTARTAERAREQAFVQARRAAFRQLVDRLVAAGDEGRVPAPDDDALRGLVSSVSVVEERFSTTRYIATVAVSFSPEAVTERLDRAGVAYTQAEAKPRLVLPLLERAGAVELWRDGNPWAAALASDLARNRLVPYRFARGDAGDRRRLPAARADAVDGGALDDLAQRYGVEHVVLARARLGRDYRLDRRVVDYEFSTWPRGAAGHGRVVATPDETEAELLGRAAQRVYDRIDAHWARQTRASAQQAFEMDVSVPAKSLAEWQEIRRRLVETPLVERVEVVRVGVPVSLFTIRFVGSEAKLRSAAADSGLRLVSGPRGYAIALAGATEAAETRP